MEQRIKIALAGLGNRGKEVYAKAAKVYPEDIEIVAAADLDPEKLSQAAQEYNIPKEHCFSSVEDMLKADKLADAMFITTQDRQHVGHAIPALRKGYHLLLEKPISPDIDECRELVKVARECHRRVVICHVLRYTPVYQKVKQLLDAGEIGQVVSIMAVENVGWFHQAHSFVRGNWANSDETSPMILQKCCHDMDLYMWLAGKTCRSLSSYGSTYLFRTENAPEGSTEYCLGGCQAKESCPYDAEKIYINNKLIGCNGSGKNKEEDWPLNVIVKSDITEENLLKELENGRFGKCVYRCNNNVVDHQVVNLDMTDDTTLSFTMCGFTPDISRYAKFMGTKGELVVNMDVHEFDKNEITIRKFDADITETKVDIRSLSDDFSGHGGGDIKMVKEFVEIISGKKEESPYVTSLERSVESHYCAMAAEHSRKNGGQVVKLSEFREK